MSGSRRWWYLVLMVWLGTLFTVPAQTYAQSTEWRERRTAHFAILYPVGTEQDAQEYAQFVDSVYEEVSAIFSYRTPPPVVLRIYPTMELYYQANPLAQQLPGVVAHAHTGRREISIALPQTADQPPDQIVNNVRHELTHIIAADLSGGKLSTVFQEGIAQYVEHPSAELEAKMQLMRQLLADDRLLSWNELNQPGVAYADPRIGYPQSYTMVAFLIQRNGFATFRSFIEQTKTSSGYRRALEVAYNVGADQLEQEWEAQLVSFVTDGYRRRAAGALDVTQAEALLARGDYGTAVQQLEAALSTLNRAEQPAQYEQVQQLLRRANNGQRATTLATEARSALERGDYTAAQRAAQEGRILLDALGQTMQVQVMDQYLALASNGLSAQQELVQANTELQTLRFPSARARLIAAYGAFTRLGDEHGAARARLSLMTIQRAETAFALSLVVLAAMLLGWNIHRRVNERDRMLPWG